jgi:hypothetical protein
MVHEADCLVKDLCAAITLASCITAGGSNSNLHYIDRNIRKFEHCPVQVKHAKYHDRKGVNITIEAECKGYVLDVLENNYEPRSPQKLYFLKVKLLPGPS